MRLRHAHDYQRAATRLGGLAICLVLAASVAAAQFVRPRGMRPSRGPAFATPDDFDGGFQFCRIVFRNASDGDGAGWNVDWPRADENLSTRLSELTRVPVSMDETHQPKHLLVRLTAPELFHCPFVMMTEPGGAYFDDEEAAALRKYLLKGGFLWADDFWGEYAFDFWANQIGKALPRSAYPIVDSAVGSSDLSYGPRGAAHSADPGHPVLDGQRWTNLRARPRQCCSARARNHGRSGPAHRVDDAQHRFRRCIRGRSHEPRVLSAVLGPGLCLWCQRPRLCHDTLIRARSGNLQTSSDPPLVTIRRIAAPVR